MQSAKTDNYFTLGQLMGYLKADRLFILALTAIALLLGVIYALVQPAEFTTEIKVMPELPSQSSLGSSLGGLKSLAGLAGINLDDVSGTDAVRPALYPNILQGTPFLLHIMEQPVFAKEFNKTISLIQYFEEKENTGFSATRWLFANDDDVLRQLPDPNNHSKAIQFNQKQKKIIELLGKRIGTSLDRKTGVISIFVKMPDAIISATVARQTLEYLTDYVSNYRTQKARKEVVFLTQRTAEAKARYQHAELVLTSYQDRNRFLIMQMPKVEGERHRSEYVLAQNLYNELSRQLEQAKIKVQQETPVVQALEPPQVPLVKSEPKRGQIVVIFTLLGMIIGIVSSLIRRIKLDEILV